MADISQINLPNGSSYNVKDTSALHHITAPDYDATLTYNRGDLVTYQGDVYICNMNITTPEPWNQYHWDLAHAHDDSYLHSLNPNGAGSFGMNRKPNTTVGYCSFSEGDDNTASGIASHAEGSHTRASGDMSHAEGGYTVASGNDSHAEGYRSTASSSYSHAEGSNTTASSTAAHAEGYGTTASGNYSHAEGYNTTASRSVSHAEGLDTISCGNYSHTEGMGTNANHKSQHVFGEYNVLDDSTADAINRGNYVEIVGNGTADNARSNARTLDWNGNEVLAGGLKINGTQNVATQVELTQAEYDALVQAGTVDLVNTVYFITDGNANANSASETTYDNTSSGLSATNVQDAVDEVADTLDDLNTYKPIYYTSTTDTVTISTSFFSGACKVIVARAYDTYDANIEFIAGANSSNVVISEIYKGSAVTIAKVDGKSFTISESGLANATIIIIPYRGNWSISG